MIRSTGLQKTLSLILAMVLLVSIMTPAAVSGNEDKASGIKKGLSFRRQVEWELP